MTLPTYLLTNTIINESGELTVYSEPKTLVLGCGMQDGGRTIQKAAYRL